MQKEMGYTQRERTTAGILFDYLNREKRIKIKWFQDQLNTQFEGESAERKYGISEKIGHRSCDKYFNREIPTSNKKLEVLFLGFFVILYPITKENYKKEAVAIIDYFRDSLGELSDYLIEQIPDLNEKRDKIANEESSPTDAVELRTSIFHEVIIDILSIDQKGYIPKSRPSQIIDKGETEIGQYMLQDLYSISDTNKKKSIYSITQGLSFFKERNNKLLLISGPGGQGKTEFLNNLQKKHEKKTKVISVSLVDLTATAQVNNYRKGIVVDYIEEKSYVNLDNKDIYYIIGLDGYNEYSTAKNEKTVELINLNIIQIINEIKNGDRLNVSLIITTRDIGSTKSINPLFEYFKCVTLSDTTECIYKALKIACEDKGIIFKDTHDDTEIGRLARIPMYANLLGEIVLGNKYKHAIKTKYDLFFEAYKRRAVQRIGNSKENYNRTSYFFFYYIIMPFIAFSVVTSDDALNEYSFREDKLDEYLNKLYNDKSIRYSYERMRISINEINDGNKNHNKRISADDYIDINIKIPEINETELIYHFLSEGNNITTRDNYHRLYKFNHESWRDFLVSLYIKNNIDVLKEYYLKDNAVSLSIPLNVNVNTNVAKMILQSFGLDGTKEENDRVFYNTFAISKFDLNKIEGILRFHNLAYDFVEYLQVPLTKGPNEENMELHKVLSSSSDQLLKLGDITEIVSGVCEEDQNTIINCACGILGKEGEYYRRTKDYKKVYDIIDLCNKISSNNDIIKNQHAKLYLSYFQSIILNEKIISIPDCLKEESAEKIFTQGFKKLEKLANEGFFLSSNLYGLLYSYPAPYLINHLIKMEEGRDYNKAFVVHLKSVFKSKQRGREIAYSVRQTLNLVFKKNVRVDPSSSYSPSTRFLNKLHLLKLMEYSKDNIMNESTIELAKEILSKAHGQDLSGLNYLRGCLYLYLGDRKKAREYFNSPIEGEHKLLYKIRLKYEFKNKESLNELFESLAEDASKNQNGFYDKTHPIYYYLESKDLVLSYYENLSEEKNKRITYFNDLENQYGIYALCKKIEK